MVAKLHEVRDLDQALGLDFEKEILGFNQCVGLIG